MTRREVDVGTGEEVEHPDAPPSDSPPLDFNAIDLAALNAALVQDGSVVRALAAVLFSEINILRTNAGLAVRTKIQFETALKNQMRTS